MDNNNNIFKFILDYFNAGNKKAVLKKYNNFLNNYNVYNLFKVAIKSHHDFLIYCITWRSNNDIKIYKNLINLEIKLKKIYKYRDRVCETCIPTFNFFIFLKICD